MATRKPSNQVTDRAKRYRANAAIEEQPHVCAYCGESGGRLDVEHIDGVEDNNAPANLAYACRSCNVQKGAAFRAAGVGVLTRQYNPAAGASSLDHYAGAVATLRGIAHAMSLPAAIKILQNTAAEVRARFARQLANPGAPNLGAWVNALQRAHLAKAGGYEDAEARKTIEETPFSQRSDFNREVWRRRGKNQVPF